MNQDTFYKSKETPPFVNEKGINVKGMQQIPLMSRPKYKALSCDQVAAEDAVIILGTT